MSGGRLVVLDRLGRDVKSYELPQGVAHIGRGNNCHVRVLQPAVSPLHATLIVRNAQTVVRNESNSETLVNGAAVSVAALQHGDVITVGDRTLRWDYHHPPAIRPHHHKALQPTATAVSAGARRRAPRRSSPAPAAPRSASLANDIEMRHRASMPASAGGKQVAIVQPQRRDHDTQHEPERPAMGSPRAKRARASKSESELNVTSTDTTSTATKASLWIDSRKVAAHRQNIPKPVAATPKQQTSKAYTPKQTTPAHRKTKSTPKVTLRKSVSKATPRQSSSRLATKDVTPKQNTPQVVTIQHNTSTTGQSSNTGSPRRSTSKTTPKQSPRELSLRKSISKATSPRKSTSKSISPRKSTSKATTPIQSPRETSPRKSTLKATSPRKSTSKATIPLQSTSNSSTPVQSTSRQVTPRQSASKQTTPKQSPGEVSSRKNTSKATTPIQSTLEATSPRKSTRAITPRNSSSPRKNTSKATSPLQSTSIATTPVQSISKQVTPRLNTSRKVTPRQSTSRQVTPRLSSRKQVTPRLSSTKQATPRLSSSRQMTPRQSSSRQATPRQSTTPFRAASARKPTPLRLAVLRKAQSAHKVNVMKIEDPTRIDHTKQAAIMLMTGHTPKARLSGPPRSTPLSPSLLVKRPTPLRSSTKRRTKSGSSGRHSESPRVSGATYSSPQRRGAGDGDGVSVLEITDSESQQSPPSASRSRLSPLTSPVLQSPKKSSLKDPKRATRKTESIKFDLSNLESFYDDATNASEDYSMDSNASGDDTLLRYSESPNKSPTPSPRRSIHSRSSRIMEQVGSPLRLSIKSRSSIVSPSIIPRTKTLTPSSPRSRASVIVQKALAIDTPQNDSRYSRRSQSSGSTESANDTWDTTVASAFKTRSVRNTEAYSVVDLVSDNTASASVYDSLGTTRTSSIVFGTPQSGRKTRSTINANALTSSTPYINKRLTPRSSSSSNISTSNTPKNVPRRSQSLTTPENTGPVSINSTRISRASKSRSRISDSDFQFLDDVAEESPKSSRKSKSNKPDSPNITANSKRGSRRKLTVDVSLASSQGTVTPENQNSPEEIGTPMLSIQSLLNSSQSSMASQQSQRRISSKGKAKSIGVLRSNRKTNNPKSKSFTASARKSLRSLRLDNTNDKESTPTSAVKLVQEAVKNQHSTAKKPQSKRSIIDDLNESDFVKQLFNSPVKRKLSQSMTEISRKKLFDDEEPPKRTRNTIHLTGRSPTHDSLLDRSDQFAPEDFVSPLSTPSNSPNVSGVRLLYKRNTPKNDLRRVTGVKTLFQDKGRSPRNSLTNVSGVKDIFKRKSAANDLRRVSGVKRLLAGSPKNDLSDVRGVKRIFAKQNTNNYSDVSGVEELFNESNTSRDPERLFDQLVGRPPLKAVYSKSFINRGNKPKKLNRRSLRESIEIITNNVEEWLQKELEKRVHKEKDATKTPSRLSKELQKLATDTVQGNEIRTSRVRNSTLINSLAQEGVQKSASLAYSARKLPLKKRSFVDASLEQSEQSGSMLPLKKRAVVHSTPVRGRRYDVTMNATDIRAVSPIAAVDDTTIQEMTVNRSPQRANQSPKSKSPKATSPKKITSPKQTRRRATKQNDTDNNAAQTQATSRTTKASSAKATAPIASSKGKRTRGKTIKSQTEEIIKNLPSPKPRSRRGKTQSETNKSPAKTQTKVTKKVVEQKATPTLSPKPKRGRNQASDLVTAPKPPPRRTRGKPQASPVKPKQRGRTAVPNKRRSSLVIPKKPPVLSPKPDKTRQNAKQETPKKSSRGPKKQTKAEATPKKSPPKRGRRNANQTELVLPAETSKRSRQTKKVSPIKAATDVSPKKSESKRGAKDVQSTEPTPKRGRKAATEPTPKRGRKAAVEKSPAKELPAQRGRKRKAADDETPVPAKVAKNSPKPTRGRKVAKAETSASKRSASQSTKNTANARGNAKSPAKPTKTTVTFAESPIFIAKKNAKLVKSPEKPAKRTRGAAKVASPAKKVASPAKKVASPAKKETRKAKVASPAKKVTRKAKVASPAKKVARNAIVANPAEKVASPAKKVTRNSKVASPAKKVASPAKKVTRNAKVASPAKKVASPAKRVARNAKLASPAKKAAIPAKKETRNAKVASPAKKIAKSPAKTSRTSARTAKSTTKAAKSPVKAIRATRGAKAVPVNNSTLNDKRSRKR